LFDVITYKDKAGNDEIADYIDSLGVQSSKDARIKYKKILEYIGQLKAYGVAAGKPAIDHIEGTDLWELRPLRDRIFFVYWKDNTFVLLHHFMKKTQKTPPREIEAAHRKLKDFLERSMENE
jgi:phage-related protein